MNLQDVLEKILIEDFGVDDLLNGLYVQNTIDFNNMFFTLYTGPPPGPTTQAGKIAWLRDPLNGISNSTLANAIVINFGNPMDIDAVLTLLSQSLIGEAFGFGELIGFMECMDQIALSSTLANNFSNQSLLHQLIVDNANQEYILALAMTHDPDFAKYVAENYSYLVAEAVRKLEGMSVEQYLALIKNHYDDGEDTLLYYTADAVNAKIYYPFGLEMMSYSNAEFNYEFDFNGKSTDKETGLQDYGERIYNNAYGRFLSVDPLFPEFPWNSPYAFAENDVIRCIDLDGLEKFIVTYTIDSRNNILSRRIEYVKKSQRKAGYKHHKVAYRLEYQFDDGSKELQGKDKWQFSTNPNAGFRKNSVEDEFEKRGATVDGIFFLEALEKGLAKVFYIYPLLGSNIDFVHNKPIPKNPTASDKMLQRTAEILKANPGMKIQILGHTSNEPTNYVSSDPNNPYKTGNEALSWDRAKYVNDRLIQLGVNPDQLTFDGVADTQPLPGVAPEADEQKRIEFNLIEDKLILD